MSILFTGSYQNETEPLWARAGQGGGGIGPNIQVSTLLTNSSGFLGLQASGTIASITSASISFDKTDDVADPTPSLVSIIANIPPSGGSPSENISIVNNTKTFYDPLAVGELLIYGANTVLNPVGAIGVISQVGTSTDIAITTTGLHTSSFYTSSINGGSYPPVGLGPDLIVSTINVNEAGFIRFNASGTSNAFSGGALFFQKSPDIPQTFSQAIKMSPNNLGNILPVETVENISITHVDTVKSPPGIYYDNLALGNLLVYGVNNPKASTIGQVAVLQQWSTTTDVECVTTGFHTSNLIVSTINGQIPNSGGGGSGPNLLVSTLTVNGSGSISLRATAPINFYKPIDPGAPAALDMNTVTTVVNGVSTTSDVLTVVRNYGFPATNNFTSFATGNLYVYPQNQTVLSGTGQLGIFNQWSTTTDLQCITTGFHTSSIYASNIQVASASISSLYVSSIVDYVVTVSTINATTISTTTASAPLFNASTISFQPTAGGVKVDLGLGAFAGSFAGQFAGEVTTMTIAGAALTTGAIALSLPRTQNNIYPPGQPSTFQGINTQTQLQYSTIGAATSTFYRFVSSTDGLMGTVTPGFEYIISSIIAPGTQCIRSFSDPINLANASTYTSTVQSFGYWIPVPLQPTLPFSTVTGNFNVASTLTAYNINASTTIIALGAITGGNVISQGIVSAITNISAGGNVSGVNGNFTGALNAASGTITGTLGANVLNAVSTNTTNLSTNTINSVSEYATGFISTPTANVGNLKISTINGLPYSPGGSGGTLGVFSTLFVSSMANVSSLTATGVTNTNTLIVNSNATIASTFTNSVSSFNVTAVNVSGTAGSFGSPTPTLITNTGIFNPIGQIIYGQGLISSIQTNNLSTSVVTAKALTISSINNQLYPPPFNSTIVGNFYVTSTLNARDVFATASITSQGPIGASGNITGYIGAFTEVDSSGPITGTNASIGGVIIGPAGVISGTNLTITTINGAVYPPNTAFSTVSGNFNVRSTLTAYKVNISTNLACSLINCGAVTATGTVSASGGMSALGYTSGNSFINGTSMTTDNLIINTTAAIPAITGLTTVNGVPYPPPSGVSSYQQLYTSSFQTSTINCAATATVSTLAVGNIVGSGNISAPTGNFTINGINASANFNGLSATFPGVNIALPAGTLTATAATFNSGIFVSSSVSSFFVSSINNNPYPPTVTGVSSFSTLFVSSLATVGSLSSGAITATGAVIGGVTLGPASLVSAALVSGTQVNANSITVQTNVAGNSIVALTGISYFSTMVVNGNIGAGGDNIVNFQNGAIAGTSNVNFAINMISSCIIGGNCDVAGYISSASGNISGALVAGSISTNNLSVSTIQASQFLISTPTSYIDINTAAGINIYNSTTQELSRLDQNGLFLRAGDNVTGAVGTLLPGILQIIDNLSLTTGRTSIANGNIITESLNGCSLINVASNATIYTTGSPQNAYFSRNTAVLYPGSYGQSPITYSLFVSSSYDFGSTLFVPGTPYLIPNLIVQSGQPCIIQLMYNSRGATLTNTQNIFGCVQLYGYYDDAVGIGNTFSLRQNSVSQVLQHSYIQLIQTNPGSWQVAIYSQASTPGYVGNVYASWTIQPLYPSPLN